MEVLTMKCDKCGKSVEVKQHQDSTGFVHTYGGLLAMVDIKEGESGRPSLDWEDKLYCPKCLLTIVNKWLNEISDAPIKRR